MSGMLMAVVDPVVALATIVSSEGMAEAMLVGLFHFPSR